MPDNETEANIQALNASDIGDSWTMLSKLQFPVMEYSESGELVRANGHRLETSADEHPGLSCRVRVHPDSEAAYLVVSQPTGTGGTLELHVPLLDGLVRDNLTGLYLRDIFEQLVVRQIAFLGREGLGYAVILFDLDHFKSINDTYGHPTGDRVLKAVGAGSLGCKRAGDSIGRWGGEEFCVFLPGANEAGAIAQAERIAAVIGDISIEANGEHIHPSASFGLACSSNNEPLEAVVSRADAALYHAKETRRGSIIPASSLGR